MPARPTGSPPLTIATLPRAHSSIDGWLYADEVQGALALLGFHDVSTQQVGAWLARMARADAPWVERDREPFAGAWRYRVTRFGQNDIANKLPRLRVYA